MRNADKSGGAYGVKWLVIDHSQWQAELVHMHVLATRPLEDLRNNRHQQQGGTASKIVSSQDEPSFGSPSER